VNRAVEIARNNGIVISQIAWDASQEVGVPFWATCAFLVQESGGGHNVFGHDPTIFVGAGDVTKAKYLDYKAERIKTGQCQGVGPMQLTFHTFQDEADALGGSWVPEHNVTEGLRILKGFIDNGNSWHEAAFHYNGSEAYAIQMDARFALWQRLLGDQASAGGEQSSAGGGDTIDVFAPLSWRGHTFDRMTIAAILAAEQRLGFQVVITQGSYNTTVDASGGTHDGSGALDIHFDPATSDKIVLAFRQTGFASWRRFKNSDWPDHVHCELLDDPHASDQAKSQWAAYRRGEDALGGDDLGPRLDPIPIFHFTDKPVWPKLHTTSEAVGLMQKKLQLAGFYRGGDPENFYGDRTRAAIRTFQQAQHWAGADADGLIGPVTWARIEDLPSEPPSHPKVEEAAEAIRAALDSHPKSIKLKSALSRVRSFLGSTRKPKSP
jgi:putative peptidoglycan binding protein